jgi:uncharacterized SAM-binding protein YcdF (DUF218 family)
MAEIKAQVEQATNAFEKVIAEQTTRFEGAVAELTKLQTKGIAQAQTFFEDAARHTREQVAFVEQLGAEWRKLVLASVKSAGEMFAPKA